MPIVLLEPASTLRVGGWAPIGEPTLHAATLAEPTSAYALSNAAAFAQRMEIGLTAPTFLGSHDRVRAVRIWERGRAETAGGTSAHWLTARSGTDVYCDLGGVAFDRSSTTIYNRRGPWQERPTSAGSHVGLPPLWTSDVLTGLALWAHRVGLTQTRTLQMALEVDYARAPETAIVAPGAVVDDTTAPTIAWGYTSPDDLEHTGSQVEVWAGSLASRPTSGSPIATSGTISGTSTSWISPDLDSGQHYTAFARVRQAFDGLGGDHWSAWSAPAVFEVDLATPDVPVLAATPNLNDGTIELDLEAGPDGTATTPDGYRIEYLDGTVWIPVRGTPVAGVGPHALADYEAPFGPERSYRARAFVEVSDGTIVSGWSTPISAALSYLRPTARIVDVHDPARLNIVVEPSPDRVTYWHGSDVVHHPAGLPFSVVESEPSRRTASLTFLSASPEGHDALADALSSSRPLLFRDDRRDYYYFRWAGDRTRTQDLPRAFGYDAFAGTAVEIDRPAP